MPGRFFRWYNQVLLVHPWKTQALTTGLMMGSGDIVSQMIVEQKSLKEFDKVRAIRFLAVGTFFTGPLIWMWFRTLEKYVQHANSFRQALRKMLLDQMVFSPMSYAMFLSILGALHGENIEGIKNKLNREFWPVYKANLEIWPAVQFANFYLIPLHYRLFVTKCVGLCWNTYLAWRTNRFTNED